MNLNQAATLLCCSREQVPDGQVFVLGDNRSASQDSRRFGTLPLADVTGLARRIGL